MVWLGLEDTQNTTGSQTPVKAATFPPPKCIRDFSTTGDFPTTQGKRFQYYNKEMAHTKHFRIKHTLPTSKHRKHPKNNNLLRTGRKKTTQVQGQTNQKGTQQKGLNPIRTKLDQGSGPKRNPDIQKGRKTDRLRLTGWTRLTS